MQSDIMEQFQLLNGHIAHAISAKDYVRAAALDRARRDILQDVCLMGMGVFRHLLWSSNFKFHWYEDRDIENYIPWCITFVIMILSSKNISRF